MSDIHPDQKDCGFKYEILFYIFDIYERQIYRDRCI